MGKHLATLLKTHPEYDFWIEMFPEGRVAILSAEPVTAESPDGVGEFYKMDVSQLEAEQILAICAHLSEKFDLGHDEVLVDIFTPHGLPMNAKHWRGGGAGEITQ